MPWDKCKNKMICSGSAPAPLCQWKVKMNQRRRHHNYNWTNRFLTGIVGGGYCLPQWMMYVLAWYHVEYTVHIWKSSWLSCFVVFVFLWRDGIPRRWIAGFKTEYCSRILAENSKNWTNKNNPHRQQNSTACITLLLSCDIHSYQPLFLLVWLESGRKPILLGSSIL